MFYSEKRKRVAKTFDPLKGRTRQEMKDECDINRILARAERQGILNQMFQFQETYGDQVADFTGIATFHEAMNAITQAQQVFDGLPSRVRAQFMNDPGRLLDFLDDPANHSEAVELGLLPEPQSDAEPAPKRRKASKAPPAEPPGEAPALALED